MENNNIEKIKDIIKKIKKKNKDKKDEYVQARIIYLFCILCIIALLPIYSWSFGLNQYYKFLNTNQYNLAENELMRLYQHSKYWFGENNDNTLLLLEELASLNHYKKKYLQAYIYYKKSVYLRKIYKKLNNSWGVESLKGLSTCYLEKKQYKQSVYFAEKALNISNKFGEKKVSDKLLSLINLQEVYIRINKKEKLNEIFSKLVDLQNIFESPEQEYYNNYVYAIALNHIYFKRYEKAKYLLNEAIEKNNNKVKHFYILNKIFLMKLLANIYEEKNEYDLAEKTYKNILFLTESIFGKNSLTKIHAQKKLGIFYLKINENKKSQKSFKSILKLESRYLGSFSEELMCTYYYLDKASLDKKQYLKTVLSIHNASNKFKKIDIGHIKNICNERAENL